MEEKRILFDSSITDISQQSGGSLAVLAYLNAILEIFPNRVDVITPLEYNIKSNKFNSINVPKRSKLSRNAGFVQGKLYRSTDFIITHLKNNPQKYEWIFLNGGHFAGYIVKKIREYNIEIKIAIFHHNYEPEYAMGSKSVLSLYGRTYLWVKKWERKSYENSTINLFISPDDKEIFEREYGKREDNYVIGIYEPNRATPKRVIENTEKSIAITCSLCANQNILSLSRFKEKYLNIFHENLPDWELLIMGRNPNKELLNWNREFSFVKIVPNPDNIRDLCSKSSIYLCQMDDGGGLKLRIMDGLRNGQPVITHKVSARGYNVFFNEPFFQIYDDENSFAKCLNKLSEYLKSNEFSRKHIQQKYYDNFGFDCGLEKLKKILNKYL